jgi:hypothetical protein
MIYQPWPGQAKPINGLMPIARHALTPAFCALFGEGAGTLVTDVLGGPSAPKTGANTWVSSPLGTARFFDGASYADFGSCPNLDSIATPRGVTIDAYFRQEDFTNAFMCCKYSTSYHFGLYTQGGILYFWDSSTAHVGPSYAAATWHRATIAAGSNNILFLLNGGATWHGSGATINPKTESFAIGTRGSLHDYTWTGNLGWLTIWPFEMSLEQARHIHANPFCWLGVPDLAAMWAAGGAAAGSRLFTQRNRRSVIAPGVSRC